MYFNIIIIIILFIGHKNNDTICISPRLKLIYRITIELLQIQKTLLVQIQLQKENVKLYENHVILVAV
jgi:hypothetical protein